MAAKLGIEYLDGDVGLAVGCLQFAQVQRLVHGTHAAEADTFLQHETAVQGIADTLDPIRTGSGLLEWRCAGRPACRRSRLRRGTITGLCLYTGFFCAEIVPRLHRARDPSLCLRIHVGRQRHSGMFLDKNLQQAGGIGLIRCKGTVNLRNKIAARQRTASEQTDCVSKVCHMVLRHIPVSPWSCAFILIFSQCAFSC